VFQGQETFQVSLVGVVRKNFLVDLPEIKLEGETGIV
jgi:hypothetical protein